MFFICELKKLRQLKASLLARFRCEKILATLPGQLDSRIENCDEAAALKLAEENLENAKKADAANRKKRIRKATVVAGIISLIVTIAIALLLALSTLPTVLVIVGGTLLLTLIVHLIAKSAIKNGGKRTQAEIYTCEEELALATEAFEAAKVRIEAELQEEIDHYKSILNKLNTMIKKNTVVHDSDKNYNTVCQIIWCLERKYAYGVVGAKQWIARANHSKYVRARLDEIQFAPQDEADIDIDATEGNDYSEEIPQTTEAEA
ncbi:MAG: hypothetical protein E7584_05590 [Ruminococcaceae bacterium]|nr:hypothetical protein [Oscillospiraceae bacterium]